MDCKSDLRRKQTLALQIHIHLLYPLNSAALISVRFEADSFCHIRDPAVERLAPTLFCEPYVCVLDCLAFVQRIYGQLTRLA